MHQGFISNTMLFTYLFEVTVSNKGKLYFCSIDGETSLDAAIRTVCTPISLEVTRIEVRRSSLLIDAMKEVQKNKFKSHCRLNISIACF